MLIVGLAPGMHGANRTGRPFTGDASGDFLFQALYRAGFATAPTAQVARLLGVRITNAVKCLPPGNRPKACEIRNCGRYLASELHALCGVRPRQPRVVLCLGGIAHQAVAAQLGSAVKPFRHGAHTVVRKNVHVLDTYHPSRQNTQTGRLTAAMLDRVLERARTVLDD